MDTLRIGICDDESVDLVSIALLINEYDKDENFQVMTFFRADQLLKEAWIHPFDIVLLDIEMEPPTGFEVAQALIAMPNPPAIIFATKSNAYALKGYGVALRYLQKPVSQDALFEAMDAAVSEAIAHRLTFEIEGTTYAIPLREVCFIEIFGHYSIVHAKGTTYRMRSTLKELTANLPRNYFVSPHKSYVINLEHIQSASATEVSMDSGEKIPISRKRAQEFNQALYRFLGR